MEPDYTKLEEEGDTIQIEEDYLEVEEESTLSEHKKTENRLGMDEYFAAESCREIYDKNFDSRNRSGYYWIKSAEGNIKVHTCNISYRTLHGRDQRKRCTLNFIKHSCPCALV